MNQEAVRGSDRLIGTDGFSFTGDLFDNYDDNDFTNHTFCTHTHKPNPTTGQHHFQ